VTRWTRAGVRIVAGVAALALVSGAAAARESKRECVRANTKGQSLKLDHKLGAARREFVLCSDPSCPWIVRNDCAQRLAAVERAQPTIVFEARDPSGQAVTAVRVTVDGQPLADGLDGSALAVDPGEHVFVFSATRRAPVTRQLTITEGEKDRHELIAMGPVAPPPPPPRPPVRAEKPSTWTTHKVVGVAVAGTGVAAIAVGSVFGILTSSAVSSQKSDCPSPTNCPNHAAALSDHSGAQTDAAVSSTLFVVGAALLVTGVVFWLTSPKPSESPDLAVVPAASPSGGGMWLRGRF
jgi:hypothetical protein